MTYLTKERLIHRNEAGELLPVEVEVEGLDNQIIKVLPMTRGKLQSIGNSLNNGIEQDLTILKEHVLLPKFSEWKKEDFDELSSADINSIIFAVISVSTGLPQSKVKESTLSQLTKEDYLKKNEKNSELS